MQFIMSPCRKLIIKSEVEKVENNSMRMLKIKLLMRSHQLVLLSESKSRKHESLDHAIRFNLQVELI